MSANNYTFCPRCKARIEQENQEIAAKAKTAYGKVSAEKYNEILAQVNNPNKPEETLAEYYDIGVFDGEFTVSYGCKCNKCGFEFNYEHKERVPLREN